MPSNGLPTHSAVEEKAFLVQSSWTKPLQVPIPGVKSRRLRILMPSGQFQRIGMTKLNRRRGPLLLCFACLAVLLTVLLLSRSTGVSESWGEAWPPSSDNPESTLVFRRADLQRIWRWEVESGHYPSRHPIPKEIGFTLSLQNPGIPLRKRPALSQYRPPADLATTSEDTDTVGTGSKRVYLDIRAVPPLVSYPPRPVPNSIADMDIIQDHCSFDASRYVRDCLEVLRLGGGLYNGIRMRRSPMDDWKYIFLPQHDESAFDTTDDTPVQNPIYRPIYKNVSDPDEGLVKKLDTEWESSIKLRPAITAEAHKTSSEPCDPENPRLFHMFWTGPFTDKPYLALLSFLYTQNTGIHLEDPNVGSVCRPQFWLWINPGPAAAVPNPNALRDMFEQLKLNPWASPFLHPRFKDVIKFKMWNTTEQLDGIPELKDEWRTLQDSLFNSGGYVISVAKKNVTATESANATSTSSTDEDDMTNRLGSSSSSSYDRLSVILSDMARFVLTHRFGGIYLDADTIFLRDWEELWGWKGAFAYRWSRLPKYNTAVLRMHKGSALGTFLFRTAIKNGLDFHPMTVSRYIEDAHLDGLLLRLPDALFDSAWLNTEWFQRDRPPQPYFTEFGDFFETPAQNSAAPQALGFDGFFKGAYSYHFHNFWWKPFDPSRNWPDLGTRFASGEKRARFTLAGLDPVLNATVELPSDEVYNDKQDLDWSTVMKRTFEAYIRGESPNMYGEWIHW